MNWMRLKILALTILTGPVFGAEKFLLNPAPDEDYLIKINDGGVIKDLMRFDADTNKVIVDGDLEATGVTTGFTAASAAPDWLTATPYGLNEIVVDPNSGITYRANVGHTSTGTNLTDDVSKYDIIGSASNGVIITEWASYTPTSPNSSLGTLGTSEMEFRRVGSNLELRGQIPMGTMPVTTQARLSLPPGLTNAPRSNIYMVGHWMVNKNTNAIKRGPILIQAASENYIGFGHDHFTSTLYPNSLQNSDAMFSTNNVLFIMASIPIAEWQNSGVTVSIQDLTERTKFLRNTGIITSGTGGNGVNEELIWAEKDSDGNYLVHVSLSGGDASTLTTTANYPISGITTIGSGFHGVCSVFAFDNGISNIAANCSIETNGALQIRSHGGSFDFSWITATINVGTNKPTWFDSNRENPASVSAFVPEASETTKGIVGIGAQTFAGEKTFTSNQVIHRDSIANGQVVFQHIGTPNSGVWEGLWYGRSLGSQLLQIESFSTGQSATALVQLTANMDTGDTGQGGRHQVYMGSGHTPSSYFGFGSPGVWAAWNTVFDDTDGAAMVISNPTAYRVAFSASKGGGGATDGFVNFRIQGTGLKAITLYLANGTPFELIQ